MKIEITYEEFIVLSAKFSVIEENARIKASVDFDKELERCLQPYTELKEKMGYVNIGEDKFTDVFVDEDDGFSREDILTAVEKVDRNMKESIYKDYFYINSYNYEDLTIHLVTEKETFVEDCIKKLTASFEF